MFASFTTEKREVSSAKSLKLTFNIKSLTSVFRGSLMTTYDYGSDEIVLDERLKELETWFTNRGYNSEIRKIYNEIDLNQIRSAMVTENHFLKELQKHFEHNKLLQSYITTKKQRKPAKQSNKRSAVPSATIPLPPLSPPPVLPLDSSSSSTNVHDITQFAKILADLEEDAKFWNNRKRGENISFELLQNRQNSK